MPTVFNGLTYEFRSASLASLGRKLRLALLLSQRQSWKILQYVIYVFNAKEVMVVDIDDLVDRRLADIWG